MSNEWAAARAAFVSYAADLARTVEAAESSVQQWRTARAIVADIEPYDEQVERRHPNWRWYVARPKWLRRWDPRTRLAGGDELYRHGFDARGQLRLVRQGDAVRLVCVPREDGRDFLWLAPRRPGAVQLAELRRVGAKPGAVVVLRAEAGALYERVYEADEQGRARSSVARKVLEAYRGEPARYYGGRVEEAYVLEAGELHQVVRREYHRNDECIGHDVVFSRARATRAIIAQELEAAIVEGVVAAARRFAAGEELRAVLLGYGGEDDVETTYPDFAVQFVRSDLAALLRETEWSPDALSRHGVPFHRMNDPASFDARLVSLFGEFGAHHGLFEDRAPSRRATASLLEPLRRAALALNEYDWGSVVRPTHDFVVIARDTTDQRDLAKDMRSSVPKSRWRHVGED